MILIISIVYKFSEQCAYCLHCSIKRRATIAKKFSMYMQYDNHRTPRFYDLIDNRRTKRSVNQTYNKLL